MTNQRLVVTKNLLRALADHVVTRHFPALVPAGEPPGPAVYARWFAEVCRRTAVLVAHWMRVGFVHGVMNTDNMSILGLTIDYGPYGWIEPFDLGDGQRRPLHLGTRLDLPDQGMSDLEIIIVVGNLVVPRQDGRSRR